MGNIFVIIAFVAYALVILGIGIFSYKKSKSMNDYFIGGSSEAGQRLFQPRLRI